MTHSNPKNQVNLLEKCRRMCYNYILTEIFIDSVEGYFAFE